MCDKAFAQRNKLKDHISNIHERQKPYQCSACEYKGGIKGNLSKHIVKVHEGRVKSVMEFQKKYPGPICKIHLFRN